MLDITDLSLNWIPLDDIICLHLKISLHRIPLDLISFVLDNRRISLTFRQSNAFSQSRQLHLAVSEEGFVVTTGDLKLKLFLNCLFKCSGQSDIHNDFAILIEITYTEDSSGHYYMFPIPSDHNIFKRRFIQFSKSKLSVNQNERKG